LKCFDLCAIKYPRCHGTPSIYTARRLAIVMYCLHTLRAACFYFPHAARVIYGSRLIPAAVRSLALSLLSPAHKHTHTRGAWQRQEYKSSVRTQGVGKNRPAIPIFHINFLLRSQPRQYFATRIYILERVYWTTARSNVECQTIFLTFISRAFCKLRVATRGKSRNDFNNFARAVCGFLATDKSGEGALFSYYIC
jgi:hypothetical protein